MAARAEPLQQQLLAGVYSCWGVEPATRLPTLAAAPPAAEQAQQAQQGGGDTSAAVAMLAEIWKALAVFGLLPQALGQLAAHFMEHSIAPILASGACLLKHMRPAHSWPGSAHSLFSQCCACSPCSPCCKRRRSSTPCPCAEHDPSLITDSPAGSVASSNLSRATAAGGSRSGNSVERLLYKALRALTEQASRDMRCCSAGMCQVAAAQNALRCSGAGKNCAAALRCRCQDVQVPGCAGARRRHGSQIGWHVASESLLVRLPPFMALLLSCRSWAAAESMRSSWGRCCGRSWLQPTLPPSLSRLRRRAMQR